MEQELALLVEAVRKAGAKVRELVRDGFEVQTKPDRSPVTTVDHEVNRILYEMQRREFPQDGWLSEESPDDPARLTHQRVWIVDPIDGTKALINRLPEFTISAALTERGIPIVGAILNPSTDELFTAVRGGGLYLNGSRVTLAPPRDFNAVIMISGKDFGTGEGFHRSCCCLFPQTDTHTRLCSSGAAPALIRSSARYTNRFKTGEP